MFMFCISENKIIFKLIVDEWMFIDNSGEPYEILAEGNFLSENIQNELIWKSLVCKYNK